MKKPEMADFGLTEESFKIFNRYLRAREEMIRKNKKIRIAFLIAGLFIAILIFVLLVVYSNFLIAGIVLEVFVIGFIVFTSLKDPNRLSLMAERKLLPADNYRLRDSIAAYNGAVSAYQRHQERLKREFWEKMNGFEFEKEVAMLFLKQNYSAQTTRKTGDGGVDIILTRGNERIAVQCKHHKTKVGPNDIRALQGVVHNGNFTFGIFVSLNGFTPTVRKEVLFGKDRIELYDVNDLIRIENSYSGYSSKSNQGTDPSDISLCTTEKEQTISGKIINQEIDFSSYIGKIIRRENDDFEGIVQKVNVDYLFVLITKGDRTGKEIMISRSIFSQKPNLYSFADK